MRQKRYIALLHVLLVVALIIPNVALAFSPGNNRLSAAPQADIDHAAAERVSAAGGEPAESTAAETTASSEIGRILFAPTIDLDSNPASNPVASQPVPVVDLYGHTGGVVMLAVQLAPADSTVSPLNVPVTFQLWQGIEPARSYTAVSDVWGAASVEIPLRDLQGDYAYKATAPGYGTTEVRHFRFDPHRASHILHADGLDLSYEQQGNEVHFTVTAPRPLDPTRDEVVLTVLRRAAAVPTTLAERMPEIVPAADFVLEEIPLPDLLMEIVDEDTAQLSLVLPEGEYAFLATARVNAAVMEQFYALPVRLDVAAATTLPAGDAIWISPVEYEAGQILVQHEAPAGQVHFTLAATENPPALSEKWEGQSQLLKLWRTGPFAWEEVLYDVEIETFVHDGKKAVRLEEFDYDPVSRSYTFAVKSLLDEPITDTLTIDVFGPGDVLIYQEKSEVVLRPDRLLKYTIEVPADLGKPSSLRVTLDDPLIETFRELEAAVRTVYNAASTSGESNGFFRLYADLFGEELVRYTFRYPPGSSEFRFELLEKLTEDPWELLTDLGAGFLDGSQINIFGTIFSIFDDEKSWDDILNQLFRIDVGGVGIDFGWEVGFSATADFGDCPDDADVQELEQRLDDIADGLNDLVEDRIDFQSPTLKGIKFTPIVGLNLRLRLRLGGSVTAEGLTMRVTGTGSIGATGRVVVSLQFGFNSAAYVLVTQQLANMINGILVYVDVIQVINDIINIQIPDGECDPDPPDPRPPDDRQDVWQGVEGFYQGPTHDQTIDNLNQLIQRARERGLERAERLLTLRLRDAELTRFMADRAASLGYVEEAALIAETVDADMAAIFSGTLTISPTATITENLTLRYLQGWEELNQLSYPAQLQSLQDEALIAERAYFELLGQELELQRELRELLLGDAVGVVASGFAEATLSALDYMGLPGQLISPWPGDGDFRGRPAPYVAPALAPRALVVPSGGLHALANSPAARDWLEAYVAGGGQLVVFSQAFGSDWEALPGGEVGGVGYEEDQRWQHATVEAAQPSNWLVWMGIPRPDVQIDGAFTAWPEDASILLKRTFGAFAGSPVMLEYPFGDGSVLATTAYGDWAWQTNFWWGDDARLTHSILIRAYLLAQGRDVGDVFSADPASNLTINFPLTNSGATEAVSARVEIPLVWGRRSNLVGFANVDLALASGQTGAVEATLLTPPARRGVHDWTQVGLYRTRVIVSGADGRSYTTWGPFVYVRSPVLPPPLAGNLQVAPSPTDLFGSATVSATVRNFTSVDRSVVISDLVGLPETPVTLLVPAQGSATQAYTIQADASYPLAASFYDDAGDLIGRSSLVLNVAFPDLRATPLPPAALFDGVILPVRVTNEAAQGQALSASLAMTLTAPSGVDVWQATQALPDLAAGATTTPTFTVNLPPAELGIYELRYRVDDGRGLSRLSTMPLPARLVLEPTLDRATYRIRESGVLSLTLANAGNFDLAPTVAVSATQLGLSGSQALLLPVGDGQTLTYGFVVPETLPAGNHPIDVTYEVAAEAITRTVSLVIPPATIRTEPIAASYNAGDTIAVTLRNPGGVDAPVDGTLRLSDAFGRVVATTVFTPLLAAGDSAAVTLEIPAAAAGGAYFLEVEGVIVDSGATFSRLDTLDINGVTAGLTVQTGAPAYFSDESIDALATVGVTGGALDGDLNLRICRATDPAALEVIGSGGPTTRTTYEPNETAFSWVDISATGTAVAQGDDTFSLVDLGFDFEFYGVTYSQIYVGSNGYVSFGNGYTAFSNGAIPSSSTPNNAIYGLWDDLYPVGGVYGTVFAQQVGATRFVVQWQDVSHCCTTGEPETFQIILDGADHSIKLQYQDVTATTSATVGVENADGSVATTLIYNESGVVVDRSAYLFTPLEEEIALPTDAPFKSFLYTVGDVIFFSHADGSELALYRPSDSQVIWSGTLDAGQRQIVNVPEGTYLATGSQKFAILGGDPVQNGVAGYYATDENGFGVSDELYTWTQTSFFSSREYFIVFAYEDGTNVTVEDVDTGEIYFSGVLDDGEHWESNTLHRRWLRVTGDNPVSAYTYYDQGSLIPAADGRWSGTRFYTYAGLVGNWDQDLNVLAFEDDTDVTISNLDSGEVYWTGTLNSGEVHAETFGSGTARGAAFIRVDSSKTVGAVLAPYQSWQFSGYAQGFYAPDRSGSRIGTDILTTAQNGGVLQIFAYNDDTVVEIYNSLTGALESTVNLNAGTSIDANPGFGVWRLRSNKPVSAWSGFSNFSAEFAPVVFGTIVVGSPFADDCGYVLWETTVPVSATATLDVAELVEPLDVTGRLTLDGRLYAATGQQLAQDDYPFYLHDRDTALTLETDRTVYRPGQTVTVSGQVTNTSNLTNTLTLEVLADGLPILTDTLTLAPGAGAPYSTALTASTSLTLTATADNAATSAAVQVAAPQVAADLIAPEMVGREPFSATLVISNTGVVSAAIQTALAGQPGPDLVLLPGEVARVSRSLQIAADTVVEAALSGDVTATLAETVLQGATAALDLQPPASNIAGPLALPFTLSGTGPLPAAGTLVVTVDGAPVYSRSLAVTAGATTAGAIPLELDGGRYQIAAELLDGAGVPFAAAVTELVLLAPAAPADPQPEVTAVNVAPTPVVAGETVAVTVDLTNRGGSGPVLVNLRAFAAEEQFIIAPEAHAAAQFTFEVPVPADLPTDSYFGEIVVGDQSVPFTVAVGGTDLAMELALDQVTYSAGDQATLTVTLTDQAGISGDYLLMPRYLTAEDYVTVTVPANTSVDYTFTFTATESARVNVFLSNTAGANGERRVITLDSLPVHVVQPDRAANLRFDRLVYDPGDTVQLTLDVTGVAASVVVMGPLELTYRSDGDPFLLENIPLDASGLAQPGTYNLSYTLPTMLREGRYTFQVRIDGESYAYPIDVRGYKVTTRHVELDRARYARQDTVTATVEFWNEKDTPITGLELSAWIFTPDDAGVLTLAPDATRTVDLQPGLNVFEISGAFSTPVVGSHRLLVNVGPPNSSWRVSGASAQFDVGWAQLVELTTDRGSYAPGEPGTGRLDVYGYGPTRLTVSSSDGGVLFDQVEDLAGYATYTFAIPTGVQGDYLLIADSIDQDGNTDRLIAPYNVPAPADTTPPQIVLTYPVSRTVLTATTPSVPLSVTGQAADDSGAVTVLVNGEAAPVAADGTFALPVEIYQGLNLVSAVAVDPAGNVAFTDIVIVQLLPAYGVTLAADQSQVPLGQPIQYTAVLTASGTLTDVSLLDPFPAGLVTGTVATASAGTVEVVETDVRWFGDVTAGQPVSITISVIPTVCGPLSNQAVALWGSGVASSSNSVLVDVVDLSAQSLFPIALHQDILNGAIVGQALPDIYQGGGPGNFGWLTWTGANGNQTLANSLIPPGDSDTYVNPDDPTDNELSIGDWVDGTPGLQNSSAVRDALTGLVGETITVPVWDITTGQGSKILYHIVAFAQVEITGFDLTSTNNRISAIYRGSGLSCGSAAAPAPDQILVLAPVGALWLPPSLAWLAGRS